MNEITYKLTLEQDYSKCILYSLNYYEIELLREAGDADGIYQLIENAAIKISGAGADCIGLCANTLHEYAERLQNNIKVPLIHIAEATAQEIMFAGCEKVGLLGTKKTMELPFYKEKLANSGIECIVPDKTERDYIQSVISNELVKNIFKNESRKRFLDIIDSLCTKGAAGVILGCTEIPLLVRKEDTSATLFNTLEIHAEALVEFALN